MREQPTIRFASLSASRKGTLVVLSGEKALLGRAAKRADPGGSLPRAFGVAEFSGRFGTVVEVLAPGGSDYDSLVALGVGTADGLDAHGWMRLGGAVVGHLRRKGDVGIVLDLDQATVGAAEAASLAAGILLRSYSFDKYKTRTDGSGKPNQPKYPSFTIFCAEPGRARTAFAEIQGTVEGVDIARDIVNEPANALGPVELAERALELKKLGVEVEILGENEMRELGMGALLGVAQGSVRPPRLALMQWRGGKKGEKPLAFIGKGVVFDTGGNSIKPASSMEDMRGDVGGAAAVVGALHALASRKARANVAGIIGCVENMVDGNAQRPGDIVTSMSGQTIEVLNTDAEGRLVLADAMWYCQQRFRPKLMIDLATLTGAIVVALGQHHAGLFSNDDDLAGKLTAAGLATQERLWRMPLGPEYDKLIDSKNADMKNVGGRHAGAISAAQFLQRFVKDTPWAHLDIAGTALGSPASELNQSWASGFGVRLLDRLVRDHYES